MPIAYRSDTGFITYPGVSGGQNFSFVSSQPLDGDLVAFGGGVVDNGGPYNTGGTLTDDQGLGNTYTARRSVDTNTGGTTEPFNNPVAVIFDCVNFQRNEGDATVTLTLNLGTNSYIVAGGVCFSGAETSGGFDVAANNQSGTAGQTSIASGTTATTALADSVAITTFANNNSATITSIGCSGYTVIGSVGTGATDMVGGLAYKILTTTGTQSATWAWTTGTAPNSACIAVYKGLSWVPQTSANETLHFTTSARW